MAERGKRLAFAEIGCMEALMAPQNSSGWSLNPSVVQGIGHSEGTHEGGV